MDPRTDPSLPPRMLILRAKKMALNDVICMICYILLDNGVMSTPKRRILSFIFTVLCIKNSIKKLYILKNITKY